MPKFSYGDEPKTRVQELLEALLDFANGDLADSCIQVKLTAKWDEKESCKLAVETTLEDLRQLLYGKAKVSAEAKKQQIRDMGELLTHYLGEYLQIWEDRRVTKRGSKRWIFSLKLWSQSKEENLQKFREEWQKRQPENSPASPTLSIKVEVESDNFSRVKRVFGLEAIPSIPVWVGRDELVKELIVKLHQALPPKVLALIGQGGIGKTSLSVKLLEALGVNLQPPALTKSCIYDNVLYFQVKDNSSFDDVAAFLLKGLGIETPEPLKTTKEKIGKILQGLTSDRCLLVLDNLEAILQKPSHPEAGRATSPEWGILLNQLAYSNHRSQVILTSREVPADLADARVDDSEPDPDLVHLQTLTGVEIEDGIELLRQRQLKDKEEDLRWVSHRVEGHVFLLTQLAAIARGKPGYLRKHPELVTKKAEPILQAQLTRQSEAARDLLRRMCVLRVGIDIRGLTFLRLYADDWEEDNRLIAAATVNKTLEFIDNEISETAAILARLVDSSLVQSRYDIYKYEEFYDLHQVIADFMQKQYDKLPNLFKRVYSFYRYFKNIKTPQNMDDLRLYSEPLLFAFNVGDETEALDLGMAMMTYTIRWGQGDLLENNLRQASTRVEGISQADALLGMGQVHYDLGNWDEAERYDREALAIALEEGNQSSIAAALGQLGSIQRNRGNWDEAERLYRQSLQLRTELGDRAGMAESWGVLGDIERNRGNWDEAERLYRQCLQLRTELGDRAGMASSWGVLGDIERNRGNWDEAERLYRQCLQLRTELGDRAGMAESWGVLGDIERNRGNWDEAERLYRQCLQLRTELGDRAGMAESWGVLGDIEKKRGNWDEAERLFRQCLAIETELGDRAGMAESWGVLGDIEKNRGNWDEAERLYRQSLQLRTELGDRAGMAISIGCLGETELGRGNLETAESLLKEALAKMIELGITWHIAETNYDLAQLERQRGNAEIAQQHYNTARQIFQHLGAPKDLERIEREWNN